MPNARREREEALIAEMRTNLEAYENGTEVDGFVPFELHEAITAGDVSSVLAALEAAHRREDAIRKQLDTLGDQRSGLVLQNIERIIEDKEPL